MVIESRCGTVREEDGERVRARIELDVSVVQHCEHLFKSPNVSLPNKNITEGE